MIIRDMTNLDIDNIVYYENLIFGTSLGHEMLNKELSNELAYYQVCEINGLFAGYFGMWISDITSEILNFFVVEEFRRQNVGSKLLEKAILEIENRKVKYMTLEVRESNLKAISLYKKYGFYISHKRNEYYSDGEDALLMIKEM